MGYIFGAVLQKKIEEERRVGEERGEVWRKKEGRRGEGTGVKRRGRRR